MPVIYISESPTISKLQHGLVPPDIPGPELPELHEVHLHPPPGGDTLHLLGNVLLAGAAHINIMTITGCIMTAGGFSEVWGDVVPRTMNGR